jgi:hypothetical protein
MCETRRDLRASRSQYHSSKSSEAEKPEVAEVKLPTAKRAPRKQPVGEKQESDDWTPVARAKKPSSQPKKTSSKQ